MCKSTTKFPRETTAKTTGSSPYDRVEVQTNDKDVRLIGYSDTAALSPAEARTVAIGLLVAADIVDAREDDA